MEKPNKGKGKAAAYQWQQPNIANEWYSEPGIKNGANRNGWQQNPFHQVQNQGQQAHQIAGIAPPNQRDAVGGVHADAFIRPELRGPEQQAIRYLQTPTKGHQREKQVLKGIRTQHTYSGSSRTTQTCRLIEELEKQMPSQNLNFSTKLQQLTKDKITQ